MFCKCELTSGFSIGVGRSSEVACHCSFRRPALTYRIGQSLGHRIARLAMMTALLSGSFSAT